MLSRHKRKYHSLLHDIIPCFCRTPEQGCDCRFSPPAVAAFHWSLPVTGRRTDRRTDRAQRRCLLTHASLRHRISFQLDAPADFPGVIMKLFDVGRFLITEHSAGQIRFVMTATLFMKASCACYWNNNNHRLSIHPPPRQSSRCSSYLVLRTFFRYFIKLNLSAVKVAVKVLILPPVEISLFGMQGTNWKTL